jgi:hypothetical protein
MVIVTVALGRYMLALPHMARIMLLCILGLSLPSHGLSRANNSRYMPKDEPSTGLGHRHDWEGVVVWLTSSTATTAANIVAVCPVCITFS